MAPRRSARNQDKKQKFADDPAGKENVAGVSCKPKAVKAATRQKLIGRLANFVTMPLDVLFEVRLVDSTS